MPVRLGAERGGKLVKDLSVPAECLGPKALGARQRLLRSAVPARASVACGWQTWIALHCYIVSLISQQRLPPKKEPGQTSLPCLALPCPARSAVNVGRGVCMYATSIGNKKHWNIQTRAIPI